MKRNLLLFLVTVILRSNVFSQLSLEMSPALQAELDSIPDLILGQASENTTLPESVDNANQIWMRGILDQLGDNSCAQAAGIGYTFTYEINRKRNLPSSDNVNRYPVDFTYNFLNSGINQGSHETHGWTIVEQIGCPNIDTYEPGGDGFVEGNVWMSGYDKYYSGVNNRIDTFNKINIWTHFNDLKHWLNDHGNGEETGGIATFTAETNSGVIDKQPIPNDSEEEAGKWIVANWGNTNDLHTMTIVGYNDNIMYPLNSDGVYRNDFDNNGDNLIDMRDWEIGAVKVANSWGSTWVDSNNGYIYVPYRLLFDLGYQYDSSKVYIVKAKNDYEPEIVLKAEIDHNFRDQLNFLAGYAENTDSIDPTIRKLYTAFNGKGGPFPMQGQNNFEPLETALDFSNWFADSTVGKVFFQIHRIGTYNYGTIDNFSLVDYRWDEILEVPCDNVVFPYTINEGDNTFSIDYDVLPFTMPTIGHPLEPITTNKVVRKQTVLVSGTLSIETLNTIDFYNSELVINSGATLNVGNLVMFHAKQGNCKITVNGSIQLGSNVTFIADEGCTLELYFGGNPVNIDDCHFINCTIKSTSDSLNISYSTFTNSIIGLVKHLFVDNSTFNCSSINSMAPGLSNYSATIIDCDFTLPFPESNNIISLYRFANYYISGNTFLNYTEENTGEEHCIIIEYSGTTGPTSENIISENTFNSNEAGYSNTDGITIYGSIANIFNNNIQNQHVGILLFDRSQSNLAGTTNFCYEETQVIKNNDVYQVYCSEKSFPVEFIWNAVYENTLNDVFVFHDVDMNQSPPNVGVSHNYWSDNYNPYNNLLPIGHYNITPIYDPCSKSATILTDEEVLYQTGINYIADGNFSEAKNIFQLVVTEYPESEFAVHALKELYYLEHLVKNDFSGLRNWYLTNQEILDYDHLLKLGQGLANKCNEMLGNYQAAIDWYEDMIDNPPTLQDSIFAVIDLQNVYLMMGIDTNLRGNSYVGRMPKYRPESIEAHQDYRDELLAMLLKKNSVKDQSDEDSTYTGLSKLIELLQNVPNPFSNTTSIQFNLNSSEFSSVEIRVLDQVGKEVRRIPVKSAKEGVNTVELNMQNLPSGIYYYSLIVNGTQADTKKMVVVR